MRKIILVLAALGLVASTTADAQAATLVWGRVITNNDYHHTGWGRVAWSPKLPRAHYHVQMYVTDQGNEFGQAENCIGRVDVYRASDHAPMGWLYGQTWPTDSATYHYHVYLDGYWYAAIQVRVSVRAQAHYSWQQHDFLPLENACRAMVSVQRT